MLGYEARTPWQVWFKPPAKNWRRMYTIPRSGIVVQDADACLLVLRCLKALYGLDDGPLMWQLAFLSLLKSDLSFTVSHRDENFLSKTVGYAVIAIYKFGKPKRMACPFPISVTSRKASRRTTWSCIRSRIWTR